MKTFEQLLQSKDITPDQYDDNTRLDELGLDSLDCYMLQSEIENEYNINLGESEVIFGGSRISYIKDLINRKCNGN